MAVVIDGTLGVTTPGVSNTGNESVSGTSTINAQVVSGTSTANAQIASSYNGGQLAGMRNKIINGKMEIAQRGISFVSPTFGTYTLDRFAYFGSATTATVTISQQIDVPSNNDFQISLRVAVTTADTSIAAGDTAYILQPIEGYNTRDLIGKTFTLSFWVRSAKTGKHCISFRNASTNSSYIAEYTINAIDTWEQKSITVVGGLPSTSTWNTTNSVGIYLGWVLASGSTYQTATAGSWQTGNFLSTSNQVNILDTVGNIFAITGAQLEVGSVATPFEHKPVSVELALCHRYYINTPSGSIVFNANQWNSAQFPVSMRATPTVTVTPTSGTISGTTPTIYGFHANNTATAGASYIASAEL